MTPPRWIIALRAWFCRIPGVAYATIVLVGWVSISVWVSVVCWAWLHSGQQSNSDTIRNISLVVGGVAALIVALWRSIVAARQATAAQQQAETAQRVLLNERYQRAAEMLGSNVLSVRLGGIHGLQRLAEEDPNQYHIPIMGLLCAFARHPVGDDRIASEQRGDERQEELENTRALLRDDVAAIVDVIRSRDKTSIVLERSREFTLDLRGAVLRGAQLNAANLAYAKLWYADLSAASNHPLDQTHLDDADLTKANLVSARLNGANLRGATLRDTVLVRADLSDADLEPADLSGARLAGANLSGANLGRGNTFDPDGNPLSIRLTQRQLDSACADPDNLPKLVSVLDAQTSKPLVWHAKSCDDQIWPDS